MLSVSLKYFSKILLSAFPYSIFGSIFFLEFKIRPQICRRVTWVTDMVFFLELLLTFDTALLHLVPVFCPLVLSSLSEFFPKVSLVCIPINSWQGYPSFLRQTPVCLSFGLSITGSSWIPSYTHTQTNNQPWLWSRTTLNTGVWGYILYLSFMSFWLYEIIILFSIFDL